jgi:hypothetical protein
MNAHANPSQKNALPAADLLNPVGKPEPLEANAVSKSAFTALSNNYLDAIFSNTNGNPQAVASFDARYAGNDASAVNPDGSLNVDANGLYARSELKAQLADADAANPNSSFGSLDMDAAKLAKYVDADLNAAALYTGKGNFGQANRLEWAASDAERALSDVKYAEQRKQQQG